MKKILFGLALLVLLVTQVKALSVGDPISVVSTSSGLGHKVNGFKLKDSDYSIYFYSTYLNGKYYGTYCLDPSLQTGSNYRVEYNYYSEYINNPTNWYMKNSIIMMQNAIDNNEVVYTYSSPTITGADNIAKYAGVNTALRLLRFRASKGGLATIPGSGWDWNSNYRTLFSNFTDHNEQYMIDNVTSWFTSELYPGASLVTKNLISSGLDSENNSYNKYVKNDDVGDYDNHFWEFRYAVEETNENIMYQTTGSLIEDKNKERNMYSDYNGVKGFFKNQSGDGNYFGMNLTTNVDKCENITIENLTPEVTYVCNEISIGNSHQGTKLSFYSNEPMLGNVSFTLNYDDPREASNFFQLYPTPSTNQRMFMIYRQKVSKTFSFSSGNKTCYKDYNGNYYDNNGVKIESDIAKNFILKCGCNNDVTLSDFSSSPYYTEQCGPLEETGFCDIEVKDQDCFNDSIEPNKINENSNISKYSFYIGNKNINKCVLAQVDVAKSRKSGEEEKNYQQWHNDYCQVACAENFKFTMPTFKKAVAGTYFEFFNNAQETIELNSNKICSSRVDYFKFYSDMFGNNGREEPLYGLNMNFGSRAISVDVKEPVDAKSNYIGGLNQQVIDYETLADYFAYFKEPYNYTSHTYCAEAGEDGCKRYETKYYTIQSRGGFSPSCTTDGNSSCNASYLANTYASKYNDVVNNKIPSAKNKRQEIITQVNTCHTNVKNEKIDDKPEIDYSYSETYEDEGPIEFKTTPETTETDDKNKPVEEDLNCNDLSFNEQENKFSCTSEASPYKQPINNIFDCSGENCNIFKINYTVKVLTSTRKYESKTPFYTIPASGVATQHSGGLNQLLGNVMPVALIDLGELLGGYKYVYPKSKEGSYYYNFHFSKLGDYIQNDDVNYTCYYGINNDVTTPNKTNFFYRNISLNVFNPQGRTLGKNWDNEKGKATQCEIEGGNYNYINQSCAQENAIPEEVYARAPEYSFTLTRFNFQYEFCETL